MNNRSTDWNAYYKKPKSIISTLTQRYTLNYIVKIINRTEFNDFSVIELGGGASCFAQALHRYFCISRYDIIDNCEIAIEKACSIVGINNAYYANLLDEIEDSQLTGKYDFVYSVGLVEHFGGEERKRVIENHFKLCKRGGYVLITAPTPTWKYNFVRKCMEMVHIWRFFDERPVELRILRGEMEDYGEVLEAGINWKLPLTQAVVLAKK